ncbi:MAG: hypothetical protein KF900_14195 [Bacteroidetes bacterium]|nr:hypothetical protein [Bacteroidota bacterium]
MSHHNEHHEAEQKQVAFSVPFILAAATLLVIVLFLSLCDPKAHHGEAHGHEATEAAHH